MGTKKIREPFDLRKTVAENKHTFCVIALIVLGIMLRVFEFGNLPSGLNQDEAFAGYEAYSLMKYGKDSFGYAFPCYLTVWGSGMSVLESYLAIPFIKLFGLSVFTFRLPMLICACISLPVFYLLLREMFNRKHALVGLSILAICPWHIMLSRWALDANLAPAFLLFGFYFFVKGIRNNKYFILSAFMYGAALYSYALTWAVVPMTVALCALYLLFTRQKLMWRYVIISVCVLFVMAIPLILFVLVNNGYMAEIKTSFFSVPKMPVMRDSEISPKNLIDPNCWKAFWNVFYKQNDGLPWNSLGDFGMFGFISIPFMILGIGKLIGESIRKIKEHIFSYELLILIAAFASAVCCLMLNNPNINRINSLHLNTLIFIAVGICETISWVKSGKHLKYAITVGYFFMLFNFCGTYYGAYNSQIGEYFNDGAGECVQYVKTLDVEKCAVDSSIFHPQVLFYDQTPVDEYISTVEYTNYPAAFLSVKSFGKYDFGVDYYNIGEYDAYIVKSEDIDRFSDLGYMIKPFGNYAVCVNQQR